MTDYALTADSRPLAIARWSNTIRVAAQFPANTWSMAVAVAQSVYKMRGMDAVVTGLYDTWLATSAPDHAAAQYHGTLTTPLRDVVVIDVWEG